MWYLRLDDFLYSFYSLIETKATHNIYKLCSVDYDLPSGYTIRTISFDSISTADMSPVLSFG